MKKIFASLAISISLLGTCFDVLSVEQKQGKLHITYQDDFSNLDNSSVRFELLEAPSKKSLPLVIPESVDKSLLVHGKTVQVTGTSQRSQTQSDSPFSTFYVDSIKPVSTFAASSVLSQGLVDVEKRRAIFVIVDFIDTKVSDFYSKEHLVSRIYDDATSMNKLIEQSSFGQVSFLRDADNNGEADVYGPVPLEVNKTDACDYNGWANTVIDKLNNSGVDVDLFQHQVFIFPPGIGPDENNLCGGGQAHTGCDDGSCRVWIAKEDNLDYVLAHELGHNLGLGHAGGFVNDQFYTYADWTDFMGGNNTRPTNVAHRDKLGWYDRYPNNKLTLTQSQTVNIYSLEKDISKETIGIQAVRVPVGNGIVYYLSYRQDSTFGMSKAYADKISVHEYGGAGYDDTKYIGWFDEGETYDNVEYGFSVNILSTQDDYATVQVTLDSPGLVGCITAAPSIDFNSNSQTTHEAGKSLVFDITIENNDIGENCEQRKFYLYTQFESGLVGGDIPDSVNLEASSRQSLSFPVSSDINLAPGEYDIKITADNIHSLPVTSSASYRLNTDSICSSSPPTILFDQRTKTATQAGKNMEYVLSIKNNDAGQDCAPRTFEISATLPDQLRVVTISPPVSVTSGQSQLTSINVTSEGSTPNGNYTFQINVTAPTYNTDIEASYLLTENVSSEPEDNNTTEPPPASTIPDNNDSVNNSDSGSSGGGGSGEFFLLVCIVAATLKRKRLNISSL